jgi:hypothetical protein
MEYEAESKMEEFLSKKIYWQFVFFKLLLFTMFLIVKTLFSYTGLADLDYSEKNETAICEIWSPYVMKFKRTIQTTFTG